MACLFLHTSPSQNHLPEHMGKRLSKEAYLQGILSGNKVILSRAITLCESTRPDDRLMAEKLLASLPHRTESVRIGITGSPGVGKSTFINSFGEYLLDKGHQLAVLAIDPSSGMTRGSILGDKTRMNRLVGKQQAYIRPSPSGGTLGGVASNTREAMMLCEAAGFDWILIETVGVGQSETAVRQLTDIFMLLLLPNAGDDLQGIKKGVVELADMLIIHKADGEAKSAARKSAAQYAQAVRLLSSFRMSSDEQLVMTASALERRGFDHIYQQITALQKRRTDTGAWQLNRLRQEGEWFDILVAEQLKALLRHTPSLFSLEQQLKDQVLKKEISPQLAAKLLIARLKESFT